MKIPKFYSKNEKFSSEKIFDIAISNALFEKRDQNMAIPTENVDFSPQNSHFLLKTRITFEIRNNYELFFHQK